MKATERIAEARREKKHQEELEYRRKYAEVKKIRQDRRKNVTGLDTKKDNRESRADRARRRLVLCT